MDSNEIQPAVGKGTVSSVHLGVIKPVAVGLWYSNGTQNILELSCKEAKHIHVWINISI